jgi:transcriptional antiterminator RfaH
MISPLDGSASTPELLRWYCVRAKPKHERIASVHLRKHANIEVFAPMLRFWRVRGKGGKIRVTEALFPGYFFARFDWQTRVREVNGSPGVNGIVRFGNLIPVVDDSLLETLRASLADDETVTVSTEPTPGGEVTIIEGAFRGWTALVTQYFPAKERVRVLLSLLSREVEVDVPSASVLVRETSHPLS